MIECWSKEKSLDSMVRSGMYFVVLEFPDVCDEHFI